MGLYNALYTSAFLITGEKKNFLLIYKIDRLCILVNGAKPTYNNKYH